MTAPLMSALPAELLVRCLTYLDLLSLLRCQSTCKLFKDIIASSSVLQYKMELEVNGMIDGPPGIPGMTTAASRLAALRQYLDAWSTLNPRKETILPLKDSLGLYELYGGVHAIGSKGSDGMRCLALPSILRGVEAKEWELPHTDFKVRDFGMDPDQDLLFLIEFHQESLRFRIHLVELSTGRKHPSAKVSFVVAGHPSARRSQHMFQVLALGDIIVLHINCDIFPHDDQSTDHVSVINWKKGIVIATHDTTPKRQLAGFAFLTPSHLLVPSYSLMIGSDGDTPSVDIYWIPDEKPNNEGSGLPDEAPPLVLLRSLFLPDMKLKGLRPQRLITTHFSIRSDPAPFGHSCASSPKSPFIFDPMHRIFVLRVEIAHDEHQTRPYSVFVPASTFMRAIADIEVDAEGKAQMKWVPPAEDAEVVIESDREPDDWGWEDWGPQGARLLDDHALSPHPTVPRSFVCYVYGMRVILVPNASAAQEEVDTDEDGDNVGNIRKEICIYDFSPLVVKREAHRATIAAIGAPEVEAGSSKKKGRSRFSLRFLAARRRGWLAGAGMNLSELAAAPLPTTITDTSITKVITHATSPIERLIPKFADPGWVSSSLPYVVRSSKKRYGYRTAMMDGENILLFVVEGKVRQLKILTM